MESSDDRQFSKSDYEAAFGPASATAARSKREVAHEQAKDTRKFEISLYWTRAAYFLTFITLAFGAYGALQTRSTPSPDLAVLICCLGLLGSFAWYCANRGSKQWQENWENHVDLLEDEITGPLYKVVIRRPPPKGFREWAVRQLTGPAAFSVSKINQIISVYINVIWIGLLTQSMKAAAHSGMSWFTLTITVLACIAIVTLGRSHQGEVRNDATQRTSGIREPAGSDNSKPSGT